MPAGAVTRKSSDDTIYAPYTREHDLPFRRDAGRQA